MAALEVGRVGVAATRQRKMELFAAARAHRYGAKGGIA